MAGYNYIYWKSNNALEAEADGLFPASRIAKKIGVSVRAVRHVLSPAEWHHTSKFYNRTDYYSINEAQERIDELKQWDEANKKAKPEVKHYPNCSGKFLEWSGTRNFPRCRVERFGPCNVTQKGNWFIIHLPDGDVRKKSTTRGLEIRGESGNLIAWNPD